MTSGVVSGLSGAGFVAALAAGSAWLLAPPRTRLQGEPRSLPWPRRRPRGSEERALAQACELLAADLRAGLTPGAALARAAADWPALHPVAAAADLGADVPSALRSCAATTDLPGLAVVAGYWQVAVASGGAMAPGLALVARRLRQAEAVRRVVSSELSSARATARLLAALPAVGLVMGSGVGGAPVRFLLLTPAGWVCLAVGLLLEACGLWWIGRIAAAASAG